MGIKKPTYQEAYAFARSRAQELGSVQRIIPVEGGFRVGSEHRMDFFYPNARGYTVFPIY